LSAVIANLPRDATGVAQRLQRRLSGFALVMDSVCRDVEVLQRIASELRGGFGLADADRQELACIAVRLFDAREVLEGV
jgi:hypothetical protein